VARQLNKPQTLDGNWNEAKLSLRNPNCCVVSVTGLEPHLKVLQEQLADDGPGDIDLRARIRASSHATAYHDCLQIRRSVASPSPIILAGGGNGGDVFATEDDDDDDPCGRALEELARGMASLADGPLGGGACTDVFVRIVCASNYRAREPPYHTDKAPLRGYVTLRGAGTEYMTRTCRPMEYVTLRTLGDDGSPSKCVKMADELEFIVMKGDYYDCGDSSWVTKLWRRAFACVHRSPPGVGNGGRRVIVSFDLADGDDDREWFQADTKREWRNGMTQRKSRLVA